MQLPCNVCGLLSPRVKETPRELFRSSAVIYHVTFSWALMAAALHFN